MDTSGKEKKAEYCAALMIAEIYEYGPLKVLLVITDKCPTMKKCWGIVMDEFPSGSWCCHVRHICCLC